MENDIHINENQTNFSETVIKDEIIDTEYNDGENYGSPQKCTECDKKLYQTSLETFVANDQNWKCQHCSVDTNYISNQSKGILVENYLHIKQENETTYKCNFCSVSFIRERYLIAHERVHSEDKVYNCNICNKTFTHHSNLIRHEKMHNINKIFECKLCDKSFTRERYLNVHERIHSEEKIYECSVCNEIFLQQSNLLLHKRKHVTSNSQVVINSEPTSTIPGVSTPSYKCKVCGKIFSTNNRLMRHRALHRKNQPYKRNCRICNKVFHSAVSFSKHRRNKCCLCEQQFSSRFIQIEHQKMCVTSHNIRSIDYRCDKCFQLFANKSILKAHKKSHMLENLVQNSTSNYHKRPTIDSYELKIQGQQISYISNSFSINDNIIGTPFKCSKCNITFDQEMCLIKHESIHNGAYKCKFCDEIFSIHYHLLLHKKLHSNRTPCTCDICKQEFYHERYFLLHTKAHNGEHNFTCIYCGKHFANYDNLVYHEKMHIIDVTPKSGSVKVDNPKKKRNQLRCNICKQFSSKTFHKCVPHKIIRSGKFQCETCGQKFNSSCNLKVHVRTHTGEKPYLCSSCHMSFTQLNQFKNHVKRNHNTLIPYIYIKSKTSVKNELKQGGKKMSTKKVNFLKCPQCTKVFKTKSSLNVHISITTAETPYTCSLCLLTFSQFCGYQNHMKRFHHVKEENKRKL